MSEDLQILKSRFIKIYSNLPFKIRKEVIVVIDTKPWSWDAAFSEVNNDTDLGGKILKKLEGLEIL